MVGVFGVKKYKDEDDIVFFLKDFINFRKVLIINWIFFYKKVIYKDVKKELWGENWGSNEFCLEREKDL